MSIPELAEQMGHAPAMTLATYTHVIRELKGLPALPAAEQIDTPARLVDVWWTSRPQAERHKSAKRCRFAAMARPGLEPGTPRFRSDALDPRTPRNALQIGRSRVRVAAVGFPAVCGVCLRLWAPGSGSVPPMETLRLAAPRGAPPPAPRCGRGAAFEGVARRWSREGGDLPGRGDFAPSAQPREDSGLESTRCRQRGDPPSLSAGAGPPLPLEAAVWASIGSASDRRPHVVRAPIQCFAGLVPNSASASAERRCEKDGDDDDHGDDSGAGDEQSAIHGYLLRFVRGWCPSLTKTLVGGQSFPAPGIARGRASAADGLAVTAPGRSGRLDNQEPVPVEVAEEEHRRHGGVAHVPVGVEEQAPRTPARPSSVSTATPGARSVSWSAWMSSVDNAQ